MTAAVDEHLVSALCRAAATETGDTASVVRAHLRRLAPLATDATGDALVRAAVARLDGLGTLDALLHDPEVDEVVVNGGGDVWAERDGRLARAGAIAAGDLAVVIERILAPLGRRLDRTSPIVDARLPDGSRVCAVVAPIAIDGTLLALRRFRDRALPLGAFCGPPVAAVVHHLLVTHANVVVAGATSSGKTSLLNAVLGTTAPGERIVTIEDTAELAPAGDHVVRLEARPASPDGVPPILLDQLVRTALRLRPDRLVVGEVRGPEVLALVQALNTGHDGAWSTCHANGPLDALHRLEMLVVQAAPAWPLAAVRHQLTRSIDAVVHVARTGRAARRIVAVAEVVESSGPPEVRTVVEGDHVVAATQRRRG